MLVNGTPYRTIQPSADDRGVDIIDQTRLPHDFVTVRLESMDDAASAIRNMLVRGAPLIGATAAYGMWLATLRDPSDETLAGAARILTATRPTAVNLRWSVERVMDELRPTPEDRRAEVARRCADAIADEDVAMNRAIGAHGLERLRALHTSRDGAPVNVLTHCNAGWLATVDRGTALAPIYAAHDAGVPVHVWVDETRPRNQGARLTAWELLQHGIPHTVVVDSTGGHLMQHGLVDCVITGTDRTTASGDVCNKIGTYLKALAAHDNGIPFYVAAPSPSIDWSLSDGIREIPIEIRDGVEVRSVSGRTAAGEDATVAIMPSKSPVTNFAFDVTPARLVTALITERGFAPASREGLAALFPDRTAG